MQLELVQTFIEYHLDMTRRVWDSINYITEEQFLADDIYSRGSVRNLMVHLASTDRRWLAGLKNAKEVGHLRFEESSTRAEAHQIFEQVAKDLSKYVTALTEEELDQNPNDISNPRWQVLRILSTTARIIVRLCYKGFTNSAHPPLTRISSCGSGENDHETV